MIKYFSACLLLGALSFGYSATANAAEAVCTAKVSSVQLDPGSRLLVSMTNWNGYSGGVKDSGICHLNGSQSEYCQGIYSALLVALTTQQEVSFWFKDTTTCPTGRWISLDKLGMKKFALNK
ncbi:hypothetical protein [Pseudoalteromonas sp. OOF1S-7]|uniref:hypothetical protein n=1 Tax=Pseudoalteromonas sp. OOF1S-7 TaxID=2917757 RepID=UPI001EF55127|nr:hypothetical protein [Pseudoalteromonas sp. OOF1S-7]MCG7537820.1 hypothetical protein [Pseudoalteromonas sp. OOF1S-7]